MTAGDGCVCVCVRAHVHAGCAAMLMCRSMLMRLPPAEQFLSLLWEWLLSW